MPSIASPQALSAGLSTLADAERRLASYYREAPLLIARGTYTDAWVETVNRFRKELVANEKHWYGLLRSIASSVGRESDVPVVPHWPIMPAPSTVGPQGVRGLGEAPIVVAAAPAAAPAIIWAAVALGVILIIVGGLVLWAWADEISAAVTETQRLAQNTERYQAQITEAVRRYNQCIAAGGTVEACNRAVPIPPPPLDEPQPRSNVALWILVGIGSVVVLGGLGWVLYRKYSVGRAAVAAFSGSHASRPPRLTGRPDALPAGSFDGLGRARGKRGRR